MKKIQKCLGALVLAYNTVGVSALIFPLQANPDGTYPSQHNLHGYNWAAAWNQNHAIGAIIPFNAVAVAPEWILTAEHVATVTGLVFSDGTGSHTITYLTANNQVGGQLRLAKVSPPVTRYSPLSKTEPPLETLLTIYGQSCPAKEVIRDATGATKGWVTYYGDSFFNDCNPPNYSQLRWGQVEVTSMWPLWQFSPDTAAGLNQPGTAYGDSGGTLFWGDKVVGVLNGAGFNSYRDEISGVCKGPYSKVFQPSKWCSDNPPGDYGLPKSTVDGAVPVLPYLSTIYSIISPTIRLNAGGGTTPFTQIAPGWENWRPAGQNIVNWAGYGSGPFDTTGVVNPAPPEVYRSYNYLSGPGFITYIANNLLKNETYKVRLHFAVFIGQQGTWDQWISVVGSNQFQVFYDPYVAAGGWNKATVLEFPSVTPDNNNRIEITFQPHIGLPIINGIEIVLNQ